MRLKQETKAAQAWRRTFLCKRTDFLRRTTAPNGGVVSVTLSYVCHHCQCLPLENFFWWVSSGHDEAV